MSQSRNHPFKQLTSLRAFHRLHRESLPLKIRCSNTPSPFHLRRTRSPSLLTSFLHVRRYNGSGSHRQGPFRSSAGNIVGVVIATCTGLFIYDSYVGSIKDRREQAKQAAWIQQNLILSQRNIDEERYWTLLTHTFMHVSFQHLAFNMFTLWSFGSGAIAMFGLPATAALWVGAGLTGAIASLMLPSEMKKTNTGTKAETNYLARLVLPPSVKKTDTWTEVETSYLGASGSILGIVTAMTCMTPRNKVLIFPIVS